MTDINEQVAITLPRGAWQMVIAVLCKGPWETVDPLLRAMNEQLTVLPTATNGHVESTQ